MHWKLWILLGLQMVIWCQWPNFADAESLYQLDDLSRYQEHGREYFDATARLVAIQNQGRLRIQQAIDALRQSRSTNELSYWKMDYLQQRVWLLKSKARVCIDLIHRQEMMLVQCETAAQSRSLMAQSDFYRGINALYSMQSRLKGLKDPYRLEDDLLAITLLSMGSATSTIYTTQWDQKRKELNAHLRSLRNELVYLAKNLDKIDIYGGGYASTK